jgi:hypothetical protein
VNTHSFAHGSNCFYCGIDPEYEGYDVLEKPCDGSLRPHPTEADLARWKAHDAITARLQEIVDEFEFGYGSMTMTDVLESVTALARDVARTEANAKARYTAAVGT